jgi:putative ABC transport system ATP-binding protein
MSEEREVVLQHVHVSLGHEAARVHVIKGVSLSVRRGETVSLIGSSGSGKSTLLMLMAGLEKVDSGSIYIAGTDISALNEDKLAAFRARSIGIIFQSFHLMPTMTALENVALPLELSGRAEAFDRAKHELRRVGLGDRLDHYPAQLSGGEQQRVAVARALAPDPAIVLADEPTGNLDTKTGLAISDLLFALQRERGATLVLVTHDPLLASRCDRSITLQSGEITDASLPLFTESSWTASS